MMCFIEEGWKELSDVMIQQQVYLEICNTLRRIDTNKLQGTVHDHAIKLLEEIYHVLENSAIDDRTCLDQILAIYYHEFDCIPQQRKDRLKHIFALSRERGDKAGG